MSSTAASMPAAIVATPPDRPSMLSSMLNELIRATIQSTDSASVNSGAGMNAVSRKFGTSQTQMAATPNSTASRNFHERPPRSSASPSSISTVPAPRISHNFPACDQMPGRCGWANSGTSNSIAGTFVASSRSNCPMAKVPTTPSQIANPPPRGVGALCTFRSPGWSISPQRAALRRTI